MLVVPLRSLPALRLRMIRKREKGRGTPSTRRIVDAPPPSPPLESLPFITRNSRPREKAVPSFRFLIWLTAGSCRWGPRAPHSLAAGDPKCTYSEHGAYLYGHTKRVRNIRRMRERERESMETGEEATGSSQQSYKRLTIRKESVTERTFLRFLESYSLD